MTVAERAVAEGSGSSAEPEGDDILAITPTPRVKAAAACTAIAGVLSLVLCLQAGAVLQLRGGYQAVAPVFGVLGLLGLVTGYRLSRMKNGAAWLGVGVSGAIGLAALVWFVVALLGGVFILLALLLLPLSSGALLAAVGSSAAIQRAEGARARLRSEGLDSGL